MKRGWALAFALVLAGGAAAASSPARPSASASASASANPMTADQLILQFKRPALQAALRQTPATPASRAAVRQALAALGQRHGVALHHVQTLAVGSALVAVTPASEQLDALVARLAADAEVETVEVNARMTHFTPPQR